MKQRLRKVIRWILLDRVSYKREIKRLRKENERLKHSQKRVPISVYTYDNAVDSYLPDATESEEKRRKRNNAIADISWFYEMHGQYIFPRFVGQFRSYIEQITNTRDYDLMLKGANMAIWTMHDWFEEKHQEHISEDMGMTEEDEEELEAYNS